MKKFLQFFLIFILIICFVSCSDPTTPPAPATDPIETEPPVTEPTVTEPPATEPLATEPPATEPPATEPPATESPATEPPATEPPATEPPVTESPVTNPPATDPPVTEPPVTEPPVTEPPATEPTTLGGDPIKSYDSEKFVQAGKDASKGILIKARKYSYRGKDLIIFFIENTSDKNYTIKLKVTYQSSSGQVINSVRDTYEGFAAGWQNYYVYRPDTNFDSYTYTLTTSEYSGTTYTGDISNSNSSIKLSVESTGRTWQDTRTGIGKLMAEEMTALYAYFSQVNTSSKKLYYVADYVLFDKDGEIIFLDTTRIPGVISPGSSTKSTVTKKPVYLSRTAWEDKDNANIPEKYTENVSGIVAYQTIFTANRAARERDNVTIETDYRFFSFTASNGTKIVYRLYLPYDYDPTKEYPVLLTLHGSGYQGADNVSHTPDFERFFSHPDSPAYNAIIVSPQCPPGGWWHRNITDAVMEILEFVNEQYSTDPQRQYITGISMGASGVWDILCRYPQKVSAALPVAYISGFAKENEIKNPVKIDFKNSRGQEKSMFISKEMIDIPIYYVYDDSDHIVPLSDSKLLISILESADLKHFRYKETYGMGHGGVCYYHINENDISLLEWLFDQRRETE